MKLCPDCGYKMITRAEYCSRCGYHWEKRVYKERDMRVGAKGLIKFLK